jgi:hypothetical protein
MEVFAEMVQVVGHCTSNGYLLLVIVSIDHSGLCRHVLDKVIGITVCHLKSSCIFQEANFKFRHVLRASHLVSDHLDNIASKFKI